MFGKQAVFIFLITLTSSLAVDPNNICVLLKDSAQIVDETNCAGFYTCKNGKATAGKCSDGYYFGKDAQKCLPKAQVNCLNANDAPCAGISGTQFVAMAGSCSGYFYCNNGVATAGNCPNNLYFKPDTQSCVYQSQYECAVPGGNVDMGDNPELICAYVQMDVFFGSAANCKTWLKCTSSGLKSGSCKEYSFNVQSQSCVFENTYDCQQLKGDPNETGKTPVGECTETDKTLKVKDPDYCGSYLTCVDNKYVRHSCEGGNFFDTVSRTCKSRLQAVNECDRCQGTSLTFVNNYKDDCKGYLVCSNGRTTESGECTGTNHFDEILGGCVKDKEVTYPSCLKCSYGSNGCTVLTTTPPSGGNTDETTAGGNTNETPAGGTTGETPAGGTTEETTTDGTTPETTTVENLE